MSINKVLPPDRKEISRHVSVMYRHYRAYWNDHAARPDAAAPVITKNCFSVVGERVERTSLSPTENNPEQNCGPPVTESSRAPARTAAGRRHDAASRQNSVRDSRNRATEVSEMRDAHVADSDFTNRQVGPRAAQLRMPTLSARSIGRSPSRLRA